MAAPRALKISQSQPGRRQSQTVRQHHIQLFKPSETEDVRKRLIVIAKILKAGYENEMLLLNPVFLSLSIEP